MQENTTAITDVLAAMKERLAKNPGVVLESLAQSSQLTLETLITCLPSYLWHQVPGTHFQRIMEALSSWGSLTTIIHTPDVIMEYTGSMPMGVVSHGFYNLQGREGLHGHLRYKECRTVYFVSRPFMNRDTKSIQFINDQGAVMFKVFLGRTDTGDLNPDQVALYDQLITELTSVQ